MDEARTFPTSTAARTPLTLSWSGEPVSSTDEDSSSISSAVLRRMLASYATNSVSIQLDASLRYFLAPHDSGLIGYQDRLRVAVVLGDPLCASSETQAVVSAFLASRRRHRSRALFVSASREFAAHAQELGCAALKIGEEAVFDLDRYSFNGGSMKRLRYHESRARRNGVDVFDIATTDLPSHPCAADIDALTACWLGQHAIGPLGFLLAVRPLHEPAKTGKRIFVATMAGKPIAYLTGVPIPAAGAVYLEDYIRGPHVPDGTAEALFHHACLELRQRSYGYVSLGTAPLAGLTPDDTRAHPMAGSLMRAAFDRMSWPYAFQSIYRFKARFHPTRWIPKYLVYEPPFTLRSAAALAMAYTLEGASR